MISMPSRSTTGRTAEKYSGTLDDVFDVQERVSRAIADALGSLAPMVADTGETTQTLLLPLTLDGARLPLSAPPPALGEHTRALLAERRENAPVKKKRAKGGEQVFADGSSYKGAFKNSRKEGDGTLLWKDGAKFVGKFANDKRNGRGAQYLPDGSVEREGIWKDDEFAGKN